MSTTPGAEADRQQALIRKVREFFEGNNAFALTPEQRDELSRLFPGLTEAERESAERQAATRIYAG
jgi:hypothetical protein